jgi:hypothetical protein
MDFVTCNQSSLILTSFVEKWVESIVADKLRQVLMYSDFRVDKNSEKEVTADM